MKEWLKMAGLDNPDLLITGNGLSLSGGQRKKLLLLKLLAEADYASVIILDEIAAGMDQETILVLQEIIKRYGEKGDKIIFLTDHVSLSQAINFNKTIALKND